MSTSNGQDGVGAISPQNVEDTDIITVVDDDPSPSNNSATNAENMLSAVNSKDIVESLKGRIIATSKLLKCLETTKLSMTDKKQTKTKHFISTDHYFLFYRKRSGKAKDLNTDAATS